MTQKALALDSLEKIILEAKGRDRHRLPAEPELMQMLGVGRNTLRAAIDELERRGLVKRVQGRGTFVSEPHKTLVFSSWIPAEVPSQPSVRRYTDSFRGSHGSRISVDALSYPYESYPSRVREHIMSGGYVDVIQLNPYWLPSFRNTGALQNLEGYVGVHERSIRYPHDLRSCRMDGELYAISWTLAPLVLYYNKKLLESTGVDAERPPETLEDLQSMCNQVNRCADGESFGICLPDLPCESSVMWLNPFLRAFGGGFSDGVDDLNPDSRENIAALTWLRELLRHGGSQEQKSITETRFAFASGKCAFILDGSYGRGFIDHMSNGSMRFGRDYGICIIPRGPAGRSESTLLSHSLSVSATAREPELAYELISHLCNDETNARLYYQESGMIPANRHLLQSPYFQDDPFASVLIRQIATASPGRVDHPLFASVLPFISAVYGQIIKGQRQIEDGMEFLRQVRTMLRSIEFYS